MSCVPCMRVHVRACACACVYTHVHVWASNGVLCVSMRVDACRCVSMRVVCVDASRCEQCEQRCGRRVDARRGVSMCPPVFVRVYTCTHVYMCIYYMHTYIYMYLYTYIYVCIYLCIYVCIYICIYKCIHI